MVIGTEWVDASSDIIRRSQVFSTAPVRKILNSVSGSNNQLFKNYTNSGHHVGISVVEDEGEGISVVEDEGEGISVVEDEGEGISVVEDEDEGMSVVEDEGEGMH